MKKKILFLLNSLVVGGSERKAVNLVNRFAEKSYEVHLGYLQGPTTLFPLVSQSVSVWHGKRKRRCDFGEMQRYRDYVIRSGISTVIAVNMYPMLFHMLALVGKRTKPTLFVSTNATMVLDKKEKVQMLLYRVLMKGVDGIIFGSDFQLKTWKTKYRLGPTNNLKVIYNGVDIEHFTMTDAEGIRKKFRETHEIKTDCIVIGMVASFLPVKRNCDLLKAGQILKEKGYNVRLFFAGDGPGLRSCIREARRLGMEEHTIFLGNVLDVRLILAGLDIFVLTSASETFSNAALEAMAMAKPIIMTNVGGGGEMIEDGGNGFLFSPGDILKLAKKLEDVINSDLFETMGQRSRSIVTEKFSIENMLRQYEEIL